MLTGWAKAHPPLKIAHPEIDKISISPIDSNDVGLMYSSGHKIKAI
jgi:hypothetical protein